jgi:hypothetical protein
MRFKNLKLVLVFTAWKDGYEQKEYNVVINFWFVGRSVLLTSVRQDTAATFVIPITTFSWHHERNMCEAFGSAPTGSNTVCNIV